MTKLLLVTFSKHLKTFQTNSTNLCYYQMKKTYLKKLAVDRFQFMYGDGHGVAYLLDPRYLGDGMKSDLKDEVEDFIFQFLVDGPPTHDEAVKMSSEYTEWQVRARAARDKKVLNST